MKSLAFALVAVLASGGGVTAHRLDEYLQATRVSIARDGLSLDMDLTPGVTIASAIVEALDTDGDDAIASSEAEAYGRAVLSDVRVAFDGAPVGMRLVGIEIPTIDEMRNGMGTIRLRAAGSVEAGAGRHRLDFFNHHRPDTSVYMVNALVPDDRGVAIVSQSRDPRQREFHLEATVRPQWPMRLLWLGMGGAGVAAMTMGKRKMRNEV